MLTQEDLQILETLFDKKLEPINARLDRMDDRFDRMDARLDRIEEDLAEVRENAEITRGATNYLVEWVEGLEKKVDRAM